MSITIFCPSSHLILKAARCSKCGWERPASGKIGQIAWEPINLGVELGGPGRHVFARPAIIAGVAAVPLSNHEIIGIGLADGKQRWRITLPEGMAARSLVQHGQKFLVSLSDERPIGQAGSGQLVSFDTASGRIALVWQADGHQLGDPLVSGSQLFLRTSTSELIALQTSPMVQVKWRIPLNTWWPLQLHLSNALILYCDGNAMQGEGHLVAVRAEDGTRVWSHPTQGLLSQPPASLDGFVVFQDGRKKITGLDLKTGKPVWEQRVDHVYTAPVANGTSIFFAMRGTSKKEETGYYLLRVIDPASGQTRWESPLPSRVLISPLWHENKIYMASEDGHLFVFSDRDGKLLHDQALTDDTDPLRTELVIADELLLIGTYQGNILSVRIGEQSEELKSPQAYLEQGDLEMMAAAYVLKGDLAKAAGIFADRIKDIPKALAIYEYEKMYQDAAKLARAQGLLSEAERYFELMGDRESQAAIMLERGNKFGAAQIYEQIKKTPVAAKLYEESGNLSQALKLYRQLRDTDAIIRLSDSLDDVDLLIQEGKVDAAGKAALKAGAFRRAAEIFRSSGDSVQELDAWLKHVQKDPEEYAFTRIAEMARKSGRFVDEAEALERIRKPRTAAQAYQRAGEQMEARNPTELGRIAYLYGKAVDLYAECGMEVEEHYSRDRVARCLSLPIVRIMGKTTKDFKESEWNILELRIANEGYGVASLLRWMLKADHFDIEDKSGVWTLHSLAEGMEKRIEVHIRPRQGEIGEAVPLALEWYWQAADGTKYKENIGTSVNVKGKDDSHPTGPPVIIHGNVINTSQYQDIHGDNLQAGSQKGDKVEINRGSGAKINIGEDRLNPGEGNRKAEVPCPVCGLPIDDDSRFCGHCQNEVNLVSDGKRKRK